MANHPTLKPCKRLLTDTKVKAAKPKPDGKPLNLTDGGGMYLHIKPSGKFWRYNYRVNPRKTYPIDTGLIPIFDRSGKANLGHILETAVLHELGRRGAELGYVRTIAGFEVDFLARYPNGRSELIQVCTNLDAPETAQREIRALQDAANQYPAAQPLLLVLERPTALDVPSGIHVETVLDWLLE
ncbi:MAG: DUF4143 domain-containing protein [Candidatus Thiothrix moscowensis]|nr:DUF4143 domain-containing protein [Candidatus Thiothrix moscowensis]